MSTIVEAIVPAEEFALQETSEAFDDITFRLERVVAQNADHVIPFMWVGGVEREPFEAALREDSSVKGFEIVTDLKAKWLYQMDWVDRIDALIRTIVDEEAVLLEAEGSDDTWELKFLFLEREAIRRVRDNFEQAGASFDVHRIYDQREGALGTHGLTEKQHRTLARAIETGYYEVPRRTNAVDLAADLDISHQALSEQLRRAHATVVANAVGTDESVLENGHESDV